MDETVLWVVAIGCAVLGFLLLAVAGMVAMFWNSGGQGERGTSQDERSHSRGNITPAAHGRQPVGSPSAQQAGGGSLLAWVKACIFAFFHASAVSVVFGGITFFEDLMKAGEEIQSTGTVTFPRQLLPGAVSGPSSRKRLSQPSDADSPPGTAWEEMHLTKESGADGDD